MAMNNITMSDIRELKPRITVFGVGGAGGNAVNNMINGQMQGVEFVVANTDAQALTLSRANHIIQMGVQVTEGLGAGSQPEVGRAAAEEELEAIRQYLNGSHMVFITAGMGGGTGTGAAPVVARAAREMGILTVGVVTKPFHFEGQRRMRVAESGIQELMSAVDTLIVIPNQNLFRVANEKTTFADAFALADQVLFSGVSCITDLMVKEGLINLDFADVRAIMRGMGKAMMGTGEATGEKRATAAAEQAIANPLLDEVSMRGAKGLLISITGGRDMTLYEVDEAATRIREEVDQDANIILGATFDESLEGMIRVSVVATGIEQIAGSEYGLNTAQVAKPRPAFQSGFGVQSQPAAIAQPATTMMQPAPAVAAAPTMMSPSMVNRLAAAPVIAQAAVATATNYAANMAAEAVARELSALGEPAMMQSNREAQVSAESFIPPVADRAMKPVRMPTAEELPTPVQNQMKAATQVHADMVQPQSAEKRRMTLLEKLVKGGILRSQDEASAEPAVMQAESVQESTMPVAPATVAPQMQPQQTYKPAQGQLDNYGRVSPVIKATNADEDALDIPAFLRRQS